VDQRLRSKQWRAVRYTPNVLTAQFYVVVTSLTCKLTNERAPDCSFSFNSLPLIFSSQTLCLKSSSSRPPYRHVIAYGTRCPRAVDDNSGLLRSLPHLPDLIPLFLSPYIFFFFLSPFLTFATCHLFSTYLNSSALFAWRFVRTRSFLRPA
jgi:hypothetical protein